MHFDSLGLSAELLRAVREEGYETPTPIQIQAIPEVLAGRDLIAAAQTGTGKTAAFTLPLLHVLGQRKAASAPSKRVIRALILTPTRELAMQVEESVRTYGKYSDLKSTTIFGGVNIKPQMRALRNGTEILVATPGRLLDLRAQGCIDMSRLEILVLDEADRMLDMGFIRDIRKILAFLPEKRQSLLFSATFSDEILGLASNLLKDPVRVEVAPRNAGVETVRHLVHPVDRERKRELLSHIIKGQGIWQVLVFTRTKHGASRLAQQLDREGIPSAAIHGDKSQAQRVRALSDFKAGKVQVLVATDIAARGLDIDQLPHVINYELPQVAEDYVHRIGRTGRAGSEGTALSLVCVDEHGLLRDIERLMKRKLPMETISGYEPDPHAQAQSLRGVRTARHSSGSNSAPQRRDHNGGGRSNSNRDHSAPRQNGHATPRSRTGISAHPPRPASSSPRNF